MYVLGISNNTLDQDEESKHGPKKASNIPNIDFSSYAL